MACVPSGKQGREQPAVTWVGAQHKVFTFQIDPL